MKSGEYFVKIIEYDNNQEILRKIVCIDSDKVEMF